jgi:hypothetical protein
VVATATLSKSFGAQGGLVLGLPEVREHLVNRARPFIYDTGLAPPAAGGALAALLVITGASELTGRVRANAAVLADACGIHPPAGAVLSVPMPGPREGLASVTAAAGPGVWVVASAHPRRHLPAPADRPLASHQRRTPLGGQGAAPYRAQGWPITAYGEARQLVRDTRSGARHDKLSASATEAR